MKVKIELRRFRAVSLARAGKNEVMRLGLQGIWLDFAKNRIMATNSHMMMITLPGYGMEIESAPTEHTYLNIPAYAVKQILKIADKKSEWLIIESDNETDAVITDAISDDVARLSGAARIPFKFNKSEIPDIDALISMDCSCENQSAGFFGEPFSAHYLRKAVKAAIILKKGLPSLRFYPSLSENKAANIILNDEMLVLLMRRKISGIQPPSLDWEQAA